MINNYLKEHFIDFKEKSGVYTIADKTYSVVEPDTSGKVLDEGFELMIEGNQPETDFYIFQFGDDYFYTPSESPEVQMNPLKYIGEKSGIKIPLPYVGVHGSFELLNGSRSYEDWCKKAKFLKYNVLGICEKNTLAGTMKFQKACKSAGIKPIIGASYSVLIGDVKGTIKFYVQDLLGWSNLLKLNEICNVKNNGHISVSDALKYSEGLICVVDTKDVNFDTYKANFKEFYYQIDGTEFESNTIDKEYLLNLNKYLKHSLSKAVLIQDSYYLDKGDWEAKELLNKIAGSKTEHKSHNQYMKTVDELSNELAHLLKKDDFFKILQKTISLFSKIDFEIETGKRHLPEYKMTDEEAKKFKNNEDLFWHLINKGFAEKGIRESKYIDRLQREFKIIKKGGVVDYFLILWDIIKWSHKNGIISGFARGSAAGSLISYLLGITYINPIEFDLLFERFLTEGRLGKTETHDKVILNTDEGVVEYWTDDNVIVKRNGKKIVVFAKEIKENDILY